MTPASEWLMIWLLLHLEKFWRLRMLLRKVYGCELRVLVHLTILKKFHRLFLQDSVNFKVQ